MANIKVEKKVVWAVDIVESEAGWGSKVDETLYWREEDEQEARSYVKEYNEKYNPPLKPGQQTPGWYMIAQGPYKRFILKEV